MDKNDLAAKHCVPCEGWMKPFSKGQFRPYLKNVPDWEVVNDKAITRDFKFKDFKEALGFVNKVAEIAEEENHHPDLNLHNWNRVRVTLTTHAIKGLSENDFILAVKIDKLV